MPQKNSAAPSNRSNSAGGIPKINTHLITLSLTQPLLLRVAWSRPSMCECGRWTRIWIGFITEVHSLNETVVDSKHVEYLAIRKNVALNTLDELAHFDADPASVFLADCKRLDMGIEFAPLSNPIRTDLFLSHHLAALGGLGPAHVLRHERECAVDVPPIKCGVRLLNHGLNVCH